MVDVGSAPETTRSLLEPAELVELGKLFHGLLGSDPTRRLKRLVPSIAGTLPPFDPVDRTEGAFTDWLDACDRDELVSLLGLFPTHALASFVRERIRGGAGGADSAMPYYVLSGRLLVINRDRFWHQLPELVSGSRRILLVRGERYSGKTYTVQFLREAARRSPVPVDVPYVDVIGANSVVKIALAAMRQMRGDTTSMPTNDASGEQDRASSQGWWVNQIAEWLVLEAHREPNRQRWLVFDGYERVEEDSDTTQLMSALAARALAHSGDPNGFRLVLLDHPDRLPAAASGAHLREVLDVDDVDDLKVHALLTRALPKEAADTLRAVAKDIVAQATDRASRLELIHELCRRVIFKGE